MNKYYGVVVFVLALALTSTSSGLAGSFSGAKALSTPAQRPMLNAPNLPTNQIIIQYKASAAARLQPAQADVMQRLSQVAGVPLQYQRAMSGDAHVLRLPGKLPLDQVQGIVARLMTSPDVEYAEPDQIMVHTLDPQGIAAAPSFGPLLLAPNDPQYTNQWHYYETWGINAPTAWDITTGSASVVVAVIDTGITNHAEFVGRTVPGYDFITDAWMANDGNGRDSDPSDPGDWTAADDCYAGWPGDDSGWHGTHTAGTVGATGNNSLGVAGINWNSKILPVRVLGKCGGYTSDIADGMSWSAGLAVSGVPANANPAKVLSISLGGPGACSATYQNAIDAITAAGAVVVVAAGNDSVDASGFRPANCDGVITVAATDRNGDMAWYSNYGTSVEISAPGGDTSVSSNGVLSTLNTGTQGPVADTYAYSQGTSMAAPHVSGVVSLLFSLNPALTPAQVLQILQDTARAFPVGGTCTTSFCGSGIVDAGAAAAYVAGVPTRTPTITPTATITSTPSPGGCNAGAITINDADAASPYPSTITLAGLGASITDVNVQLLGLTHTFPDDIDILLVGPQGQNLIVMSDAGGFDTINNINLTLDDGAPEALPDDTSVASGVYSPADYEIGDTFPAPAPAPSSATALATFNGTNPNGVWSLYVVDDAGGDMGSFTGGWCLNVVASSSPTFTPTSTPTGALTPTPTRTVTATATVTLTPTGPTPTQTQTATQTNIPTRTPTITLTPNPATALPFNEGFEGSFPPSGWFTEPVTGASATWGQAADTVHPSGGGTHGGASLAYFNSFNAAVGDSARLYTPNLNFGPAGYYYLSFWMYHDLEYNNADDYLQIEINNGSGWINVGGSIHRYDGTQGWSQNTIDLSAYAGQVIRVSLKGVSAYGNDIHVDDIVIYSQASPIPTATFTKTPTATLTNTHTPTPTVTPTMTPHPCSLSGAPAVITVPAGNVSALIQAINLANTHCGDTLELGASSVYTLTTSNNNTNGSNGLPSITSRMTIHGNGATIARSSAEGTANFRIFYIGASGELTITKVAIQNGRALGAGGGGIYNAGTLILNDLSVNANQAVGGSGSNGTSYSSGGISGGNGGTGGSGLGGGIYNTGNLTILNVTISGNSAVGGRGGNGGNGGMGNTGSMGFPGAPGITMSCFNRNVPCYGGNGGTGGMGGTGGRGGNGGNGGNGGMGQGGGIYNAGTLSVSYSTIAGNQSSSGSGGSAGSGGAGGLGGSGGIGGMGGGCSGLYSFCVYGMRGSNGPTGFAGSPGSTGLSGSTGTSAGGGVYNTSISFTSGNTILASNSAGSSADGSGPLISAGHNLIQSTSGLTITGDTLTNITGLGPLLGPLQDNGGPTFTRALSTGSPAIDAGDNTGCPDRDQRGYLRPIDGDTNGSAVCDIGAYEAGSVLAPTHTPTPTATVTRTSTLTPTKSPTRTLTPTVSPTRTMTRTRTVTPTLSPTRTLTPTQTATGTLPTRTPTRTPSPTRTPTPIGTPTYRVYLPLAIR